MIMKINKVSVTLLVFLKPNLSTQDSSDKVKSIVPTRQELFDEAKVQHITYRGY